jgi:hypothetical protein
MQLDLITVVYIVGGVILPLFYLPQIRRCYLDNSGLASFSMTKAAVMTVLRLAMLPFVLRVGNDVMSFIVVLDTAGRLLELLAAVKSLRRQGWTSYEVLLRMVPSLSRQDPTTAAQAPQASPAGAFVAAEVATPAAQEFDEVPPPPARIASGFMYLEPTPPAPAPAQPQDEQRALPTMSPMKVTMRTPA